MFKSLIAVGKKLLNLVFMVFRLVYILPNGMSAWPSWCWSLIEAVPVIDPLNGGVVSTRDQRELDNILTPLIFGT